MPQGWVVDPLTDTIVFNEAPPVGGANNVVVTETATADINSTDVWAFGAWNAGFGYPAEVEFYADRLCFANTRRQPQTIWMSKSSSYIDFGKSVPLLDEDSITVTINARQVNAILELVPLSDLLVMTRSAEWKLTTGQDEVVAPGKVGFKPQTFWGSSNLPAVVVGESGLMVARSGDVVRDIAFQFTDDKYKGNDLSVYARHLFAEHEIVAHAFQQHPHSCLWLVRDDGRLISLTYVREQEVVGWALHETDGDIKRICCVPEGRTDTLYMTVERVIEGVPRLYQEKLVARDLEDPRDAFFVDCGLTYDGRAQAGSVTVSYTPGDFGLPDSYILESTLPVFTLGTANVGDVIRVRIPSESEVDGELVTTYVEYRLRIDAVPSTTQAEVYPLSEPENKQIVWNALDPEWAVYADWEWLRDTISGLAHLEGKTVAVLADGFVVEDLVVTGGAIALEAPAAVVHVGLPYRSYIESLSANVPGAESVRDRQKLIPEVSLLVHKSRGLQAGTRWDVLYDFKVREFEGYESPISLVSGILKIGTNTGWDENGRFLVVQEQPLPCTILSLTPEVTVAGV